MRHIPEANPFKAADRYPGASPAVRRALSQVNVESLTIRRILTACAKLKLKPKAPFYVANTSEWAHIGLPEKKVVIYLPGFGDPRKVEVKRQAWERLGWSMLDVSIGVIERTTDDALPVHLKAAISSVSK